MIELPEPAEHVTSDVAADNLVVVGARTGGLYVIDLATRAPLLALDRGRALDAAWVGSDAIVACTAGGLIELVPATGEAPPPGAPPTGPDAADADAGDRGDDGGEVDDESREGDDAGDNPRSTWERVAAWREQVRRRTVSPASPDVRPAADRRRSATNDSGWRDVLAAWARGVLAGGAARTPEIDPGPAHDVAARLDLDGELTRALWLAYGAHLCGQDGVAPIDVASVTARRWDEALGAGRPGGDRRPGLAPEPDATHARAQGRARRATAAHRDADRGRRRGRRTSRSRSSRRPTCRGTRSWSGPPPGGVGSWRRRRRDGRAGSRSRPGSAASAPLVPWARMGAALVEPPAHAIVVVEDDAAAAGLGLDVVARWPGPAGG